MKKLLIATDTWHPKVDGVVRFLSQVIYPLSKKFNITILAPDFDGKKSNNTIKFKTSKVLKIGGYNSVSPSFRTFSKIKRCVKESDIVWSQDLALLGLTSIIYGKRYNKYVVNYVHQITWEHLAGVITKGPKIKNIVSSIARIISRWIYNKCDLLMVPSKRVVDILERNKIKTRKVIVGLGVDTMLFLPPRNKNEAKLAIGLDPNNFVIGYVGRLTKEKDLETLHRAFLLLKKRHKNISLLIVGGGKKSDENALKSEGVIVTGFVKDVARYLKAMDVFVLPSLTETTSLATMEAMACGVPVIVTPVGSLPDYVEKGKNGYFFKHGDFYSLREIIERLMLDEKKRLAMGINARKKIASMTWKNTIEKIISLLN